MAPLKKIVIQTYYMKMNKNANKTFLCICIHLLIYVIMCGEGLRRFHSWGVVGFVGPLTAET
jgi:hypothetical protein